MNTSQVRLSATLVALLVVAGCAAPDFHQPNLVGLHLPAEHPAATKFSVEVNGCRGNEFVVKTR